MLARATRRTPQVKIGYRRIVASGTRKGRESTIFSLSQPASTGKLPGTYRTNYVQDVVLHVCPLLPRPQLDNIVAGDLQRVGDRQQRRDIEPVALNCQPVGPHFAEQGV